MSATGLVDTETTTDTLIVGAGPVGLMMAAELRRHGSTCRIIDRLTRPTGWPKAIGIQPRTLEIWEQMGIVREAIDAGLWLRGQLVFTDGKPGDPIDLQVPDGTYGFLALPQYDVERILTEHLERLGTAVDRGVELRAFTQDADGVSATLTRPDGSTETVRAGYLVGCDGAHSVVRHGLGLIFEGDRFPEEYMLGDVEVDWSMPPGYALRFLAEAPGGGQDVLVCVPLPGRSRYRLSMLAPPELRQATGPEHGMAGDRPGPELGQIQAVVDRLVPGKPAVGNLRWSSLFGISHRIVDRYGVGRVFVCGDAAHIHPPTGAQGANTGMQDAYNLAWKLALALRGLAAPELLTTYDAERRPVGEEVVGRTVRYARTQSIGEAGDTVRTGLAREGQLLVAYPDSPLSSAALDFPDALNDGPCPGERAPDVHGLTQEGLGFPVRLFELLHAPCHTLILYADAMAAQEGLGGFEALASQLRERCAGLLRVYAVLAADAPQPDLVGVPVLRDGSGAFRARYAVARSAAYLIRPDGYVGFRAQPVKFESITAHLERTFT
ncbi:FAD-dependent monooxygenase [Nonomuraea africana]|uniref:2-polyprenyl-6-methoxyphenol hydroxylase-like FAD-dependent oxidoreductase n=1 Tax=Nonomuraea africana TaxID=46171 RepID=A0ABR9KUI0_9ACTN|nr:FAD-dependent monooxygenase [Nonomuraea africana]MBE1565167.1 2-polyprenyl-6-methoxyphenol hydroxylase-like FAD-dependent oxidoreductase [Nonomuraea africana]